MTNQMKRELYTVEQLAILLSVTDRTILESIRANEIKAYKRFKKWYIKHTDVLEFITSAKTNIENENENVNE